LIKSLTKHMIVVLFIEILMDLCLLEKAQKSVADNNLSSLVKENKEQIASSARKKLKEGERVEKVSIEASVKIGENHFHDATVEIRKISVLRKVYLSSKGAIYREVSFREPVCGVTLFITLKLVACK